MTTAHRQIVWFVYLLFLLIATLGVLTSFRHVAAVSGLTVGALLSPLVLVYAWVRFCVWLWKPLYRQEVSPGWCLALLFAFFAVVFLVQIGYFLVQYLFAP